MNAVPHLNREEIAELERKFRIMAHSVANWLTVMKSLADLSQSNPAGYEKLIRTKLMQSPQIVAKMQELAFEFDLHINRKAGEMFGALEAPIFAERIRFLTA